MNSKMVLGLLLLVGSYFPLVFPRSMFTNPEQFFLGYPIVPGNLLGGAASLLALGIILLSEGVCEKLGAPRLSELATGSRRGLARAIVAAAVAGLVLELMAQWLGKLWIYPYWTPWFYWLALIPGFVFYWIAIVESYVAAKALLDFGAASPRRPQKRLSGGLVALLGIAGAVILVVAVWLYATWYQTRGGYVFAVIEPVQSAPKFAYVLLAFLGALLLAEWGLHRLGLPSLASSLGAGYRVPAVAVVVSSVLVSLLVESQNAVYRFWTYTNFPEPSLTLWGVPLTVFATWPLQYLAFLLIASLFGRPLAKLFWCSAT